MAFDEQQFLEYYDTSVDLGKEYNSLDSRRREISSIISPVKKKVDTNVKTKLSDLETRVKDTKENLIQNIKDMLVYVRANPIELIGAVEELEKDFPTQDTRVSFYLESNPSLEADTLCKYLYVLSHAEDLMKSDLDLKQFGRSIHIDGPEIFSNSEGLCLIMNESNYYNSEKHAYGSLDQKDGRLQLSYTKPRPLTSERCLTEFTSLIQYDACRFVEDFFNKIKEKHPGASFNYSVKVSFKEEVAVPAT